MNTGGEGSVPDASASSGSGQTGVAADSASTGAPYGLKPIWLKIGFYLVLLVWMGYIVYESLGYSRFENYFFPVMIGVPVICLILIQLLLIKYPRVFDRIRPGGSTEEFDMFDVVEGMEESPRTKVEQYRYEIAIMAWVVVLPFMNHYLGMGITTLLYTYTLTYYLTRDARTSLLVTIVVVLFVWILFIEILGMIIWPGTLEIPDPFRILSDLRIA